MGIMLTAPILLSLADDHAERAAAHGSHALSSIVFAAAAFEGFLSEATWKELAARYDTMQLMDVVFTVGQYNLVSMAVNTLGVQQDEGFPGFPAS